VLSFIKASPGPFAPSADEIIKLRDAGISPTVISAMLQREAELRNEAVAASSAAAANAPVLSDQAPQAPQDEQQVQTPPATPPSDSYADYSGDYGQPAASTVVYVNGTAGYPWWGGWWYPSAFFFPFPCWFNGAFFAHGCFFPHGCFVHGGFVNN